MRMPDMLAQEEQIGALLAAWDEALAAGALPTLSLAHDTAPEVRERLMKGLACIRLVRRFLRPAVAPDTPALKRLDRFEIRRELGRGAFGLVFLAYDPRLGREVALKVPRLEALVTPLLRERFLREARAAASLDHPNLVSVFEAGEVGPICYIASAYCPGPTLADWLRQRREPASPAVAAQLIATLAEAVQHAHDRGVVHRDLKPANVLLHVQSPAADAVPVCPLQSACCTPRITDFGLAKILDAGDDSQTHSGVIVGTPCYMAPEQAAGKGRAVGPAADVYALGAMLYELLTLRPPFHALTPLDTALKVVRDELPAPRTFNSTIPIDLETVCLKCLHKEPSRRYAAARELADDLQRFLAGKPVLARPISRVERVGKWARRHPTRAVLIVVSILAALALLAGVWWHIVRLQVEHDRAREHEEQANHLRGVADFERDRARQREETARRHLYTAQLNLARHAWEAGRISRVLELLEDQSPQDGQSDLRGFEWHYLWRLCHASRYQWRVEGQGREGAMSQGKPFALSPDGRLAATSAGCVVHLWDVASGKHRAGLRGHTAEVRCLSFAADGRMLVAGADDGGVRSWNAQTGEALTVFAGHGSAVCGVTLSSDGKWLAAAGTAGKIRLWEVEGRRAAALLEAGPIEGTRLLAFAPKGGTLACVAGEHREQVQLWDVASGARRAVLVGHTSQVDSLVFCPDARLIATRSQDRTGRLWDTATGKEESVFRAADGGWITCMAFSPDGQSLATAIGHPFNFLKSGGVKLWDAHGRTQRAAWDVPAGGGWSLAFSPDGTALAVGSNSGSIDVRDLASGQSRSTLHGHRDRVHFLSFDSEGTRLTSFSRFDRTVQGWDPLVRPQPLLLRGHPEQAASVAFAPDGRLWASGGGHDGAAKLWRAGKREEYAILRGHVGTVTALAFAPDGRTLATGGGDGGLCLWWLGSRTLRFPPRRHRGPIHCLRFSANGELLACALSSGGPGARGEVRVWDAATGVERAACRPCPHAVRAVVWCSSRCGGNRSLVAAGEESVWGWDVESGQERFRWKLNGEAFMALALSPDGRTLAAGGWSGLIRLWDLDTNQLRFTLKGHAGPVLSLAFRPDGQSLASGSHDATVKLWDVATGQMRFTLHGHHDRIEAIAFSPDGLALAAALKEGHVELWDAHPHPGNNQPDDAPSSPAESQLAAVVWKLRWRNPRFDGKVKARLANGVVEELELSADEITDLSPLRELPDLKVLRCDGSAPGKGRLKDLSDLRGMALTSLSCSATQITDLSPLAGQPLRELNCSQTPIADLSDLQGLPLQILRCGGTRVTDLSALRRLPLVSLHCNDTRIKDLSPLATEKLRELNIAGTPIADLAPLRRAPLHVLICHTTPVADLSPLRGLPLETLLCYQTRITDLSPLRGMPLRSLDCTSTRIDDLSPLRGMPLVDLRCGQTRITDLSPLRGMPLALFWCYNVRIDDLAPLQDLPLTNLSCEVQTDNDEAVVRSIRTLQHIRGWPAALFWEQRQRERTVRKP